MEFKHVEYFIETCVHPSMSQAAEALFISQQALSKCMANLEAELGCKLFRRTSKGSTLTEEGRYFYDQFNPVVMNYRSTVSRMVAYLERKPRKVTFACAPFLFRALDASLLLAFQDEHPDITLERLEMSDKDVDEYVEADETHFGLLAIPRNRHGERFDFVHVKTLPLMLYVHKDHPLAKRERVDFSELRNESFLMLDKRSHYHSIIREKSKKAGFTPREAFESSDDEQLCSLVNAGRGIFLATDDPTISASYPNIVLVPFTDETLTYSISFIFQDYDKLGGAAKKFIEYMVDNV